MGHSEDDAVTNTKYEMKTHWQNQLKISVLIDLASSVELDMKKDRFYTCPVPL